MALQAVSFAKVASIPVCPPRLLRPIAKYVSLASIQHTKDRVVASSVLWAHFKIEEAVSHVNHAPHCLVLLTWMFGQVSKKINHLNSIPITPFSFYVLGNWSTSSRRILFLLMVWAGCGGVEKGFCRPCGKNEFKGTSGVCMPCADCVEPG
jgi:hypothetical protein